MMSLDNLCLHARIDGPHAQHRQHRDALSTELGGTLRYSGGQIVASASF